MSGATTSPRRYAIRPHPTRMPAIYDSGNHLHPNDLGSNTMGHVVDLTLFD